MTEVANNSHLAEATMLMAETQLALEAEGYHEPLVAAAIARARGSAQFKVRFISQDIRGRAFLDVLRHELAGCEKWLQQEMNGCEEEAGAVTQ